MSIATRINAIEEHIGNAYDKLEDLGIDLTNVDKNIDNIAEMIDTVYEEYPKVTGTGTSVTLNGTKVGKLSLDIKGNSTQDGTPSPTNEVPILSSGDNGSISEKIVNKNKFDGEITIGSVINSSGGLSPSALGWHSNNFYPVKPNTIYIVSYSSTDYTFGMRVAQYTANQTFSIRPVTYTSEYSFTTGNDIYYVKLSGGVKDSNIQLEEGSTATTYTAHQEQTYTIPVQQSMRSIGTVRDEFIKVDGSWYERHNVGSIILNGTENWSYNQDGGHRRFDLSIPNAVAGSSSSNPIKANYFKSAYAIADGNIFLSNVGNKIGVIYDTYSNVNDFKTWLSTHNTEIIYQLTAPTDLPCTSEQIAILENLPTSYNEQTNIYSLDVTPAYIEAEALKGE